MNPNDLSTAEGAMAFLEHTMGVLHGEFARNGEIRPHAVVFLRRSPDGEELRDPEGKPAVGIGFVFADELVGGADKDAFAGMIAALVERTRACGVLMVMESWLVVTSNRADLPRDLSTPFPGRKEGIMLILEHVAFPDPVVRWSLIERTSSGKGYPRAFEQYAEHMRIAGRFANLFQRSSS